MKIPLATGLPIPSPCVAVTGGTCMNPSAPKNLRLRKNSSIPAIASVLTARDSETGVNLQR